MANLNPYLTFEGICKEAMEFYFKCLEGKDWFLANAGDTPMEVPESDKNKVVHCSFNFEGSHLMASDNMGGNKLSVGNNFSLSVNANDTSEAEKYFNNLSEGGKIVMPLQKTFWAESFGMFTDKFGINWMVNCEAKRNKN